MVILKLFFSTSRAATLKKRKNAEWNTMRSVAIPELMSLSSSLYVIVLGSEYRTYWAFERKTYTEAFIKVKSMHFGYSLLYKA